MRISNNIPALNAYRNLQKNNNRLSKALERLSSGLKINRAADDAAGLAISEKLRSQIRGLQQAMKNAQDGVSLLQTADGALNETSSVLLRIRELSVQASSDTLTSSDRMEIQKEIDQLVDEINITAQTTQFNKKSLLDGSMTALWSSSHLSTHAYIHDSLSSTLVDGNVVSYAGNYNIDVSVTNPGESQLLKSNIFEIATTELVRIENISEATELLPGPPEIEWAQNYGGSGIDSTRSIQQTIDGGYIAAGPSWIFKIDANDGAYEWGHHYGARSIQQTIDGGYIAAGSRANRSFIYKLDSYGAIEWERLYGGSGSDGASSIQQTTDGGYIVAGSSSSNDGDVGGNHGFFDYWVLKLDSEGDIDWSRNYGGSSHDYGDSIQQTTDGGYIVVGSMLSNDIDFSNNYGGYDIGILKLDSEGDIVWSRNYGGSNSEGASSIQQTTDGGYIVAGGSSSNNYDVGGNYGGSDCWVLKIDSEGVIDWSRNYGGSGNDGASSIQQTIDGGYIVAGGSRSSDYDVGGNYGSEDYWVLKLDREGDIEWEQNYGGSDWDRAYDIQQTTDGGYIVAGSSYSSDYDVGGNYGHSDDWIVKLRSLYNFDTPKRTYHTLEKSVGITETSVLTLYQSEGKAHITINPEDTIETLAQKLNQAISEELGQGKYVDDPTKFVTIADGTEATSEALYRVEDMEDGMQKEYATLLIRSALPGENGKIHFTGDDKLLNALGLSTIQEAKESVFSVNTTDAHSGKVIHDNEKIQGHYFKHFLGDSVGLSFDPMAGISAVWDEAQKKYLFNTSSNPYNTTLHLAGRSTKVHIGSNQNINMEIALGDMSAKGIRLTSSPLLVITRDLANKALSQIDVAINKVSSERAKIGAFQNRLEHTINNLMVSNMNQTASESYIRDSDIAIELQQLTKHQILSQASTMMLSQANMRPSIILQLMGSI